MGWGGGGGGAGKWGMGAGEGEGWPPRAIAAAVGRGETYLIFFVFSHYLSPSHNTFLAYKKSHCSISLTFAVKDKHKPACQKGLLKKYFACQKNIC
jgi:hypothetical protein